MIINKRKYENIVVKVGSSLIIDDKNIRIKWLQNFVKNISDLYQQNCKVVIVSSGAVALGKQKLQIDNKKLTIQQKQACAALGQIELMSFYKELFAQHNFNVAQILLTASDCNDRERYNNCNNTIQTLLANNIIPIINENDSVAVDEIKIGDNDRLCARVAQMIKADLMILLSDVDGLFNKNPKTHKNAKFIESVEKITPDIEKMAQGSASKVGTGGMITKLMAAKMANSANCHTIITNGLEINALKKLATNQKSFTIFGDQKIVKTNSKHISQSKKNWLAGFINVKGKIIINDNAVKTLTSKKVSLLAVGAVGVDGNFSSQEIIFICDQNNQHIATGVVNYASEDIKKILGKNSKQIAEILGKKSKPELVNIDNIIIIK